MSILIFIIVIVALIVVHEFGHFIAAKLSGMRVDEFGLGYPPRAFTIATVGETAYTLNWLPFGGFVKIHGEDGAEDADPRAFAARPRILQAIVLVAGVAMNLLFAYVLIAGALVAGTPRALAPSEVSQAQHVMLTVAQALPGSPAVRAGLVPGDSILEAHDASGSWHASDPTSFSDFIAASGGEPIALTVDHNDQQVSRTVSATTGLIPSEPSRYAIGVEVGTTGILPMSLGQALFEGANLTWATTVLTAKGLAHFFYGVLTFSANLSQVAGPVGIAGVVGSASAQGFGDLLSVMAIISINLALINLLPVPALDGGRLLFVIIEGITRRKISPNVARTINSIGFLLLILLMVVVTGHDIFKLVG